jgi:hypothetical protein
LANQQPFEQSREKKIAVDDNPLAKLIKEFQIPTGQKRRRADVVLIIYTKMFISRRSSLRTYDFFRQVFPLLPSKEKIREEFRSEIHGFPTL